MYVVLEALRAGQHKNIYCGVLQVRKTRYYFKNYSYPCHVLRSDSLYSLENGDLRVLMRRRVSLRMYWTTTCYLHKLTLICYNALN
jgi:hypothetical protein